MNEYTNNNQEQENGQSSEPQDYGWQNQQSGQNQNWQNDNQYNQGWQNNDQYNQSWQNNSQYNQPPRKEKNNLALASMLIGIFSFINCCIPFIQFPLAVTAIVLAIISKKGRPFTGFAIAGLVVGIISVLISLGMTLYWGLVLDMMQDPEFMEIYNEIMQMYEIPQQ